MPCRPSSRPWRCSWTTTNVGCNRWWKRCSRRCCNFGRPFLKAIAMGDGLAVLADLHAYPHAAALLLDAHARGAAGGTGQTFDWSLLPAGMLQPLVLAGGLDAQNVGAGIRALHPWAVDVSSGVESAPGIKAADKLAAFIQAVHAADAA